MTGGKGQRGVGAFPPVAPTFVGSCTVVSGAAGARGVDNENPGNRDRTLAPFVLKLGHGARPAAVAGGS